MKDTAPKGTRTARPRTSFRKRTVDASVVGLNKAAKLAEESGVVVELIQADLADYDLGENRRDGIVSIRVRYASR